MFTWSPQVILKITLQQLVHYYEEMDRHREHIASTETSLHMIRQVLFSWLGVSEPKGKSLDAAIGNTSFPTTKLPYDDLLAWEKAGYPPLEKWLQQRRK